MLMDRIHSPSTSMHTKQIAFTNLQLQYTYTVICICQLQSAYVKTPAITAFYIHITQHHFRSHVVNIMLIDCLYRFIVCANNVPLYSIYICTYYIHTTQCVIAITLLLAGLQSCLSREAGQLLLKIGTHFVPTPECVCPLQQ